MPGGAQQAVPAGGAMGANMNMGQMHAMGMFGMGQTVPAMPMGTYPSSQPMGMAVGGMGVQQPMMQ